jgi:prephenate dehydratase
MKKIAFLGPAGTYCERAAKYYTENIIKQKCSLIACKTIPDIFQMIYCDNADEIVVPVENSIEGTVNLTLDNLFLYKELIIKNEIILKIDHCLLANNNCKKFKVIYSHPHALAQCRNYLKNNFKNVNQRAVESTAKAALLVSNDIEAGAIASKETGKKYGLKIVAETIQDFKANLTQFWVISKEKIEKSNKQSKTSIIAALPKDKPGGLYEILGILARYSINLTKIQSRPTKKELGEYLFYIDLEGHMEDRNVKDALYKLEEHCSFLRILGSYPIGGV